MTWKIKLQHGAKIPVRKHDRDAGYDLNFVGYVMSNGDDLWFDDYPQKSTFLIGPRKVCRLKTGIKIQMPKCEREGYAYEIQIRPRSGLASEGITVMNSPGTVDEGYTGDIDILIYNGSSDTVCIDPYSRVAQMVISEVKIDVDFVEVDEFDDSDRGDSGFGSTGT